MTPAVGRGVVWSLSLFCVLALADCSRGDEGGAAPGKARVLFLHHSTGECVWNGGVAAWFDAYNRANGTRYEIREQAFPKDQPYGWENYPYDYWNIWVRHAGDRPCKGEPTLEMLAPKHDVIVFKHCFPVSAIEADTGNPDVASPEKRIENYKLQYAALKKKLNAFPRTKFLLWTGAALVRGETNEAAARRARDFFHWVRRAWDRPGDNIYLWDFRALETEGGLYLGAAYAQGDSHPNETFSRKVAPLFCRRVVDVIRGAGDAGSITGKGGRPVKLATGNAVAAPPPKPAPVPGPEPAPARRAPEGTGPRSAVKPTPGAWVFDDGEDPKRQGRLWGKGASYALDVKTHRIRINFAEGREEDWGEYGRQRIVTTRAPRKNFPIAQYRYGAFRIRADRDMEVVFTLVTRPDSLPRGDESHFQFSAYLHLKAGAWKPVVLDLTKLELSAEGDKAYAAAGKPARPNHLTCVKLVTNRKNEKADVRLDDIVFYRVLPNELRGFVSEP